MAATSELVIIADRDRSDSHDVWRCLDAEIGAELWNLTYEARGELDYGNSPRATPLLHDGRVYLLGALGHLHCVELATGDVPWSKDLLADFGAELPIWGYCSSPLIAGGKLILNPGGPETSLVALDPATGELLWATPGRPAAYASFIVADVHGAAQVIGYDKNSLGGWDLATGRRLWEVFPEIAGDFNVPSPVVSGERLVITTENNGTRLYEFDADGRLLPRPVARFTALAPDCSTPVLLGDRLFGVSKELSCLETADGRLDLAWSGRDRAFHDYASVIGAADRVLITTTAGELILLDARASEFHVRGRVSIIDDEAEVHAHPALVGQRLYVRSATTLYCLDLADDQE